MDDYRKKIPRPVDLSEVIDFKSILDEYNCNGELKDGVSVLNCDFDRPIFCLESRPGMYWHFGLRKVSVCIRLRMLFTELTFVESVGFYFIPGALSMKEQCQWIRESLTSFPQPPNRTNHNAIYGPIEDLFVSAKEGKVLVEEERSVDDACTPRYKFVEEFGESNGKDACKSVSASVLLRKLRWSTLGLQFDWSKVLLESSFLIVFLNCY